MDEKRISDFAEEKNRTGGNENTSLLRVGVIFLALVSFFTTANGMKQYIFAENGVIAYAASAAIQSILLALSMNLPRYLGGLWKAAMPYKFINFILCVIVLALTGVAIFCSSWFSYVYIANVIHQDSWDTDSALLVQQTYRTELYDARDYAHTYRNYLEESVGDDILRLEQQAQTLSDSDASGVDVAWEDEKNNYLGDSGTAASYMSPVISAMETAMRPNASQESRNLAATAIADAQENISNRIEVIRENLAGVNTNIANYNTQMANLTTRLNRATNAAVIASLNASINDLTQLINSETQRQISLQQENAQLDNALLRLPFYESLLGLNSSTSAISIRAQLIQMQSEFFNQNPDDEKLLDIAKGIFDDLRNAASTVSEAGDTTANEFSYTNLLVQMNRLIRNLTSYSDIKAIESDLDGLIAELRLASENEPDQNGNIMEPDENVQNAENKTTPMNSDTWKEIWHKRLENLKAQISAIPVYSEAVRTETGTVSILTESQMNILRSYNRNESCAALDDMIRRYISDHNAIYQGLIYLSSPYKMLAVFALCLALAFDLSGFVFGFVMQGQGEPHRNQKEDSSKDTLSSRIAAAASPVKSRNRQTEWSILEHFHQYRVLTGDFKFKDDVYYYQVFRDGLAEQWKINARDSAELCKQGIYILSEDRKGESSPGKLVPDTEKEVLYSGQSGGPQDGVYVNCRLVYKDGSLCILASDLSESFICSLEEYVPVHCYSPVEKEHRTFPVKRLVEKRAFVAKITVVALNKSGTRVSAVYMIKGS